MPPVDLRGRSQCWVAGLCGIRSVWTLSSSSSPVSISLLFFFCLLTHSVTENSLSDLLQCDSHGSDHWTAFLETRTMSKKADLVLMSQSPSPWLFCPRCGLYPELAGWTPSRYRKVPAIGLTLFLSSIIQLFHEIYQNQVSRQS